MSFHDFIQEGFRIALATLRKRKRRAFLSSLGIIVGTFCIIGIFTAIDSLQEQIKANILLFANARQVFVDKWGFHFVDDYPYWRYIARPYPTRSEYEFLVRRSAQAEAMAMYSIRVGVPIQRTNHVVYTPYMYGITQSYPDVNDFPVTQGRFFSPTETENAHAVIILGASVAENLFSGTDPIKKYVRIKGKDFLVAGVLKSFGRGIGFSTIDENVYIPHRTFARLYRVGQKGAFTRIVALAYEDDKERDKLISELNTLMRIKRGLGTRKEANFSINKVETFFSLLNAFFVVLKGIGLVIGSFSIVIGAFNVANIMFVSVKERSFEIGLQKALGARRSFILYQFVLEAAILGLLGGVMGLGLVYACSWIPIAVLDITLRWSNVGLGMGISLLTGIGAGWLPAARAARMDPIQALQSEH